MLVDSDTDEVYLGELNPRISGASAITNVTAGAYADVPLFAFHLLEYFDMPFEFDVDEINARWRELAAEDLWSQMVIKETSSAVQLITEAPLTVDGNFFESNKTRTGSPPAKLSGVSVLAASPATLMRKSDQKPMKWVSKRFKKRRQE